MEKMINPKEALSEEQMFNGLSEILSIKAELSPSMNITIFITYKTS